MTTSVRFCLSNDLFKQDFITFKMNISSIWKCSVDMDVANDFTHTCQSVISLRTYNFMTWRYSLNNSNGVVGVVISPVSVESLQRKYIKVRFLRDFERDCSGVGGGGVITLMWPHQYQERKGKKRRKFLSGNTDLELRDKSEYWGKFKAYCSYLTGIISHISPQKHILWPIIRTIPLREGSYEGPQCMKNRMVG